MSVDNIDTLDAGGVTRNVKTLPPLGSAADAASLPVTKSTEDKAVSAGIKTAVETVAGAVDSTKMKSKVADGDDAALGAKADAAATTDAGTFSLIALVKRLLGFITEAFAGTKSLSVKTNQIVKSQEITRPSDTTPYGANDVVGPTGGAAVGVLSDFFAANGASGYIAKVELITDKAADTSPYRIYFFNTAPTAIADNSPFVLTYADFAKMIGYVDINNMSQESSSSTGAWGLWTGQMPAKAADADNDLYYVIVIKAALTPSSAQKYSVKVTNDSNG